MNSSHLFDGTRSLDLEIDENLSSEEQFTESCVLPAVVENPALATLQDIFLKTLDEPEGDDDPDMDFVGCTLTASMYSTLLESLPNLVYLRFTSHFGFQFVRRENETLGKAYQVRPLLGLQNLKVLRLVPNIARNKDDPLNIYTPLNGIWLMTFLMNLTHLEILIHFFSEDEESLEHHKDAFAGRSRVTHLDLSFQIEAELHLDGECKTTAILGEFLSVTKGLVELKLQNIVAQVDTTILRLYRQLPAVGFLRSLASSSKTLKYLSLVGNFHQRVHQMDSENNQKCNHSAQSVIFKVLECISSDGQSIDAFGSNYNSPFRKVELPALNKLHLHSDQKGGLMNQFPESSLARWINKDFPKFVKEVILSERPVGGDGKIVDLGDTEMEWRKARASLEDDCTKKGLVLKVLKEGEESEYYERAQVDLSTTPSTLFEC